MPNKILRLFRNAWRALSSPAIGLAYMKWVWSLFKTGKPAMASFASRIQFTGFVNFSEYLMRRAGLDEEDLDAISLVRTFAKPQALALDLGGNLGLFSLALAKAGFEQVITFEPIPETRARLKHNLSLNPELEKRITVSELGIGEKPGKVVFSFNKSSPGQSKIHNQECDLDTVEEIECDISTLDLLMQERDLNSVLFLKMDVEGYECAVLKGGMKMFQEGRIGFVYSEVISEAFENAGSSLEEFERLLAAADLEPVIMDTTQSQKLISVSLDQALVAAGGRRNVLLRSKKFRFFENAG